MLQGRLDRIVDLLELGQVAAVDEEIAEHSRLAEDVRDPVGLWHDVLWRAMRALLDGRFDDAERLADRALAIGAPIRRRTAEQYHWTQKFWIRREQGRLEEMPPPHWSRFQVALPTLRLGTVIAYSELGREEDARRALSQVSRADLAGSRKDLNWLLATAQLSEVCARLGERDLAAHLLELLRPYASRCLVGGRGVVCLGSVEQRLGLLCAVTSRWPEAEQHFETALDRHVGMGARACLARTQQQYAEMLLDRGERDDRDKAVGLLAQAAGIGGELGMKRLLETVANLTARAQAAAPT
jgi:hypothetical protein